MVNKLLILVVLTMEELKNLPNYKILSISPTQDSILEENTVSHNVLLHVLNNNLDVILSL